MATVYNPTSVKVAPVVAPKAVAEATTPMAQPSYQTGITDQINQLKQSQISANTAALGASRDASLSGLNAEKAKIAPEYYASRNAASTQSQLGAKNFAEFLANRGQANSGLAGQEQISNGAALQGQIGALNQQEAGVNSDIARRQTDVGNVYNSGVAQATAQANATASQNNIAELNTQRQNSIQADQFAKTFGLSQQELANTIKQQGIQNAMQNKQFNQSVSEFSQQMGLSKAQYASSLDQWAKSFAQNTSQFNQTLSSSTSQYAQTLALQKQQLAAQNANAAADRATTERNASLARAAAANKGPTAAQVAASAKQNTQAATSDAFSRLNELANQGQTRSQIMTAYNNNYSTFSNGGADMDALYKQLDQSFKWDG